MTWYLLYGGLGASQKWSGLTQKIFPPPGFDSRTGQPVAILSILSRPFAIFNIIKNNFILQFTLPTPNVDAENMTFIKYCFIPSAAVENDAFLLYILHSLDVKFQTVQFINGYEISDFITCSLHVEV